MWKEETVVECSGLNIDRWLAKLVRCGYAVRDVVWKDSHTLRMTIGTNEVKLFALFENSCYNKTIKMNILFRSGKTIWCKRLFRRCGLIFGGIACFAVLLWLTSCVRTVRIELNGDCTFTEREIRTVLYERGIRPGIAKRGFVLGQVNRILTSSFESVSFATAKLEGVLLEVEVFAKPTVPIVPEDQANLYATRSGVVTGVLVYSGTAAVQVGDTVEEGQLLIEGKRYAPDGSYEVVPADGKVFGTCTVEYVKKFESTVIEPYRTGRQATVYRYEIFGAEFPEREFACEFSAYEVEQRVTWLFPDTFLPIRRRTLTVYELAYEEIFEDFEKVGKVLTEEAEREALEQASALGEVLETRIEITDTAAGKDISVKVAVRLALTEKLRSEVAEPENSGD